MALLDSNPLEQATIGLELENNTFNLNPYFSSSSSLLFDKQNTVESFQKE